MRTPHPRPPLDVRPLRASPRARRFAGAAIACAVAALAAAPSRVLAGDPKPPPLLPATPTPGAREGAPADVHAFVPWLRHEDWLCRALAARELSRRSEDDTVGILSKAIGAEEDDRVLCFLLGALTSRPRPDLSIEGGPELVDRLIALSTRSHAVVRSRAIGVLSPLPPVALGADPHAYAEWWSRAREAYAYERETHVRRREAARAAAAAAAAAGAGRPPLPGARTFTPLSLRRYADLERIRREGLEVVVCLDATGSMEPVIAEAKATIVRLVRRMRSLAPRFRVGLVTYDDEARLRLALTTDEGAAERAFSKVVADGGGDYEEGVDKAIGIALRQEKVAWSQKAVRVILVVGDAPPHDEDLAGLLRAIEKARADERFDAPVRVDTIGTAGSSDVPRFETIAKTGGGTNVRLRSTQGLLAELVASSFGGEWREAIREMLVDLDAIDVALGGLAGAGPR